jgi:hypothetical protein
VMLSSGQRQPIAFLRAYVSNKYSYSRWGNFVYRQLFRGINTTRHRYYYRRSDFQLWLLIDSLLSMRIKLWWWTNLLSEQELINRESGYYKNLYDSQFSAN